MNDESKSNRRDFLRGKSALDAARGKLNSDDLDGTDNSKGPDSLSFARSSDRQSNYVEQYSKNAMACEFELFFNLHQFKQSGSAAMEAFQLIDDIEDQMTVYRDHSEVSQLNQSATSDSVVVETRLFELLKLAELISNDTNGAFDITSGPLSKVWGFDKRAGELPNEDAITGALKLVDFNNVKLNSNEHSVRLLKANIEINLNSIGKGHALDRVAERFAKLEIADFVIHGGQSSVLARGTSDPGDGDENKNAGWAVGVSHPTLPGKRLGEFRLRNQAIGTSGTARQGFFHQGKRYGHIIDPRTGWPSSRHLSTTVVSKSAALSDALATAFFVMPTEEIETYCQSNPTVSALVCRSDPKRKGRLDLVSFNVSESDWTLFE